MKADSTGIAPTLSRRRFIVAGMTTTGALVLVLPALPAPCLVQLPFVVSDEN